MSFVESEDVLAMVEGLMGRFFKEALGKELALPLPRMCYAEAMGRFGTDAPDLRFGLELRDVSDIARECGFRVFKQAVADGGQVRGICVPGGAEMPRSKVDGLVAFAQELGAGGLAWFKVRGGQPEGGVAKFFSEERDRRHPRALRARRTARCCSSWPTSAASATWCSATCARTWPASWAWSARSPRSAGWSRRRPSSATRRPASSPSSITPSPRRSPRT